MRRTVTGVGDGRRPLRARIAVVWPQPLLGVGTALVAALVLLGTWLPLVPDRAHALPTPLLVGALCLSGAIVASYQFPLPVRPHTKVYVSSIAYYLLAVLTPPPLAATAAGLGALVGERMVQSQRGTYASDVATQVGRRIVVVALGAGVAHWPGPPPLHLMALVSAALVLLVGDLVTCPLVLAPMSGEPAQRIIVDAAHRSVLVEGVQYLSGLLGVLAVQQAYAALALLLVPAVLVYVAFRTAVQAEQARQAAQDASRVAEKAVRVRDTFLAAAAHDLRTPLTVLMGQLDLLTMRVASGQALEEAWLRARLTPLTQAGARLVAAVDELTDLAQLQMGQPLPVHGAPVEIGALVQGVVSFLTTCPPTSERAGAVEITRPGAVVASGGRAGAWSGCCRMSWATRSSTVRPARRSRSTSRRRSTMRSSSCATTASASRQRRCRVCSPRFTVPPRRGTLPGAGWDWRAPARCLPNRVGRSAWRAPLGVGRP